MGDVVRFKRPKASDKHKGKTLCRSNFHKWEVLTENRFDVKQGRLVTIERCARCGETRSRRT
ncbi:conserved hypothetical protein [Thioalkalivibrio sulfidiphilus HL-EbGr7]|uniref:Uncharacterized protein n=1 Tax=Thioalkalivibrio sulfidiphilus (strain HL-EbGR7) TaxID=396588 RepID=B8GMG9_THISH|nr:hypothetical protein [Thioalkalivibrio sulfidiphilus]ACL71801.1 conserved hypothetical protein [Thioalkalivibrio sulfidiphilus HL-EbGr7]